MSRPLEHRHSDSVLNGLPIVYIGRLIGMVKRADRDRSEFGRRMLKAREEAGLTQEQVREALKISQGTLSELEGMAQSSGYTVAFAALYGCDAKWLATGEGEMRSRDVWPFQTLTPEQWAKIAPGMRHALEISLLSGLPD
jgi:transcriptional regulator with XRE-family HTH domain